MGPVQTITMGPLQSITPNKGRSASERRDWYSVPSVSASARSLSSSLKPCGPRRRFRRSPSHVPCKSRRPGSRRLYAGHHLANTRAPARLIPKENSGPSISMPTDLLIDASTAHAHPGSPGQALLERLPGPHLTRSRRAFSLDAHHDGLQPTQHQGGLAPAPEGRRWRANNPPSPAQHRLYEETSTRLPPSAFVTHELEQVVGRGD